MPSLYDMSIPLFLRALRNQFAILHKAESHCLDNNIPLSTLLEARLAPDMYALPAQIQGISNTSKNTAVRVAGITVESWPDDETTFPELYARIEKTIAFLETVNPEAFEGKEDAEVVIKTGAAFGDLRFTGLTYIQNFALPYVYYTLPGLMVHEDPADLTVMKSNFFFHQTVSYAILRNQGVPLGKFDYLGKV
ncbi:hypothetical protein LTR97_000761 [Elasticomyces elasticus]|uniref:Uncharacterized protein n=1 Tax=Elasticomyces elasticus TaxID=574655 RepID=A0AAN7WDR3_9PEZI|nr:hypothetical protein LTR97_000761 [Elasticomyces elasticus]